MDKDIPNLVTFSFNKKTSDILKSEEYGEYWPIVYILNDRKKAYIGESLNVAYRLKQHLGSGERKHFKNATVIYDNQFNKSATLDIENMLIEFMSADNKYQIQNGNAGLNPKHSYYQRELYQNKFEYIWRLLKKNELVNNDYDIICNSNLYKYSPFKSLTQDQYDTVIQIIYKYIELDNLKEEASFFIEGSAGTGKTVLAIYLAKLLADINDNRLRGVDEENYTYLDAILKIHNFDNEIKFALVISLQSLRATLKKVFKEIPGLKSSMVIGPSKVVNEKYDILIVDEAHRLRQRRSVMPGVYKMFDDNNEKLQIDNGNELDWIVQQSKYQIIFYDKYQSVRPSDIDKKVFQDFKIKGTVITHNLNTQLRVLGGQKYLDQIHAIFTDKPYAKFNTYGEYEFLLYDNVDKMIKTIKKKDKEVGLCRNIAGFSWDWKTKGLKYEYCKSNKLFDIEIDDYKYVWNTAEKNWANSKYAIDEIGCIHTIQGYDLNYAGVIIGKEVKYNKDENKVYIDKKEYKDSKGKTGINDEIELFNYIMNIYFVLLTRGMKGTYVYACDKDLHDYLSTCMLVIK